MITSSLRKLLDYLAGVVPAPERLPAGLIELARKAAVLDILAADEGLRAALGKEAQYFLLQSALGAVRLRDLREIVQALTHLAIPVMPLKGMAYALLFEKGGPRRAMSDMDLLVPAAKYQAACACMGALGYERDYPSPISHAPGYHEAGFARGDFYVEIHRAFLPGRRIAIDYQGLWERTRPAGPECQDARLLGREDMFLYHCCHTAIHEFIFGLRPLWELRRLLREDSPDLALAATRARAWGTTRMTYCTLRLCELCFPGTIGPKDLERFAPLPGFRQLLDSQVVEPSLALLTDPVHLPRAIQIFRKALMVERPLGAASYALWWVREQATLLLTRHARVRRARPK